MAIKWHKPEDREPAFDIKYPLWNKDGTWKTGHLEEIKVTSANTEYIWKDYEGNEIKDVTHYLVVEPPKTDKEFTL